jgi:hypothetical protein
MKIEIDYKGAKTTCRIESIYEPGKMVDFWKADIDSQHRALSAFATIKETWTHEQVIAAYKNHPEIHIKREFQIKIGNFDQIEELVKDGVIKGFTFDTSLSRNMSVILADSNMELNENAWLMQDMKGYWRCLDNNSHQMLMKYNKIIIEK